MSRTERIGHLVRERLGKGEVGMSLDIVAAGIALLLGLLALALDWEGKGTMGTLRAAREVRSIHSLGVRNMLGFYLLSGNYFSDVKGRHP